MAVTVSSRDKLPPLRQPIKLYGPFPEDNRLWEEDRQRLYQCLDQSLQPATGPGAFMLGIAAGTVLVSAMRKKR